MQQHNVAVLKSFQHPFGKVAELSIPAIQGTVAEIDQGHSGFYKGRLEPGADDSHWRSVNQWFNTLFFQNVLGCLYILYHGGNLLKKNTGTVPERVIAQQMSLLDDSVNQLRMGGCIFSDHEKGSVDPSFFQKIQQQGRRQGVGSSSKVRATVFLPETPL